MKKRSVEILVVAAILILQSVIYVVCGVNKAYIHMDEAYSLGLSSYHRVEIQHNDDFYDTWHTSDYYEDYISLQEDETGDWWQVYENQKNDVHPPLYYLFLRFAMGFSVGGYNPWPGIVINIVIYLFVTLLTYLIAKKLFQGQAWYREKSAVATFLSAVTMASLSSVIYIRMYAMATLWVLLTVYLHLLLRERKQAELKLLIPIGLTALAGSLTHYYYLFFLFALALIFVVRYLVNKDYKSLIRYVVTMAVAGGLSLLIFPYSIQHMFFGYRGQGFISSLLNVSQLLVNVANYLGTLHYFGFNNVLFLFVGGTLLCLYLHKHGVCSKEGYQGEWNPSVAQLLYVPSIFYFLLVAGASPWIELRYIMAICAVVFLLILYYFYRALRRILSEKKTNMIAGCLCVILLLAPIFFKIEPQVSYTDKKTIVSRVETDLNVPAFYCYNTHIEHRFLDDILLFSKLDQSYVAKDMEYTEENILDVFEGVNRTKGLLIFINEGQDHVELMDQLQQVLGMKTWEWVEHLNACDVYYIIPE